MTTSAQLTLEILSGPLDGCIISLDSSADWTSEPGSPLSFPWDEELDAPQAQLKPDRDGWTLHPTPATRRNTHLLRPDSEARLPAALQPGDILKAGNTWLLVREA
jgi:hypothetical protein